jgi:hypothetical protein
VTDALLRLVATSCRKLERLVCADCPCLSPAGIRALCEGCPELAWLHAARSRAVDDASLESVGRLSGALVSLDVRECPVSAAGFERFYDRRRQHWPRLEPTRVRVRADEHLEAYAAMAAGLRPRSTRLERCARG